MTDSRVLDIMTQQSQMESDRATWDAHYKEIAQRVSTLTPRGAGNQTPQHSDSATHNRKEPPRGFDYT